LNQACEKQQRRVGRRSGSGIPGNRRSVDKHGKAAQFLVVVCALVFSSTQIQSADPVSALHVRDHGQAHVFDIALDELRPPGARHPIAFEPVSGVDGLAARIRRFRLVSDSPDREWQPVLYFHGVPRSEQNRRYLTRDIAVRLADDRAMTSLAAYAHGAELRVVGSLQGWAIVSAESPLEALSLADEMRLAPGVLSAEPMLARQARKKVLPNDPLFGQQWHLRNTGQMGGVAGIDLHITNVWDSLRGAGVTIGIVDDGLQYTHPDLGANYDPSASYDFNGHDSDPYPDPGNGDYHGTAVAGIVGARGNNGRGVAGVAFESRLSGLRLLALPATDGDEADAMHYGNDSIQIKNNSWGASDCGSAGAVLEGPGPLMAASLEEGTARGRNGLGEIYVWASGNGGGCGEDVNYDGYANAIQVIAVAAVTSEGTAASYAETGACLVVAAPSGDTGLPGITTTDLTGNDGYNYSGAPNETGDLDYTQTFDGTSAATPMVSGVAALMLQANPRLGWRDVQEILLRSAARLQPSIPGWQTNSAGIAHHYLYGAGLVDAQAAVGMASQWANLEPMNILSHSATNLNLPVPDNDPAGVVVTLTFNAPGFRVEHATVTMTTAHPSWGDLEVTLVSPSGWESRLASPHTGDPSYDYRNWTLSSVRHWGEIGDGSWMVRVADLVPGGAGSLDSLVVTLYGSTPQAILSIDPEDQDVMVSIRAAAPGWIYQLESSADLRSWSPLTQLTISNSGDATFVDRGALKLASRLYRARLL
jgi:subtilisin-like proprotein convertase family protein